MYERSAIVLERYIEKILHLNKDYNVKVNCKNYIELIEEMEEYEIITTKEGKIIEEFDNMAKNIEDLQKQQDKICEANMNLEEDRNRLFKDLGENSTTLEKNLIKIENAIEKNNEELKKIREEFINYLADFAQRQKERNKCEKDRRIGETKHIEYIRNTTDTFEKIEYKDVVNLKNFINSDKEDFQEEVLDIMLKNGKNEKVEFNKDVIKLAIKIRMNIAEKEAECYGLIYEKMRKLIAEIDNEDLKLVKYKKALRDVSVKLAFLNAEKEYIVGFLDYERMTAISGTKAHKKMMEEACNNFQLDIEQINNLYELVIKETTNKATKKAYKELYNKTYLKNIEDKEKNFEQEVNSIKINMGTVINSNYWRIEGIKNIYEVFQSEISEKFEKDLSEYRIEEAEEYKEETEEIDNFFDKTDNYDETEKVDEFFDNASDDEYTEDEQYDYEEDDDEEYEDELFDNFDEEDNEEEEFDDQDIEDDEYDNEYDDENYEEEDDDEYDEEYEDYEDYDDYDDYDEYDEYDEYEDEKYEDDDEDIDLDDEQSSEYDEDYVVVQKTRKGVKRKTEEKKEGIFNKLFKDKKSKNEKETKKDKRTSKKK